MIRLLVAALSLAAVAGVLLAASGQTPSAFERYFTPQTMRVDLFHSGVGPERFAIDRIVNDGAWAGSRQHLVDDTNLGPYLFEVIDRRSNQVVYSRGYASIYGEWETTDEPKQGISRTFHESLRFPWPTSPVQVVVKKRDARNAFREIWSAIVDPGSPAVNRAEPNPVGVAWTVFENGPPSRKVDLVVLGDGYGASELPKFRADVRRLVEVLFSHEPFKGRRRDFNVRAIDLPSTTGGVHRPQAGVDRRTPLSVEYNIFGSERYALTFDNRTLRDVAASVPYEYVHLLINEAHYGGGGIFNAFATAAVDSAFADYIFVHEFGHHVAGLADEYYTSEVAYETGRADRPEPWEPNVTALHDPAGLKWRDLVAPGTPVPTPWEKEAFEAESREVQAKRRDLRAQRAPEAQMDALLEAARVAETALLGSMRYARTVGAFEGASYEPRGLYRPEADCIMFTRNRVGFCRVCQRAISRIIDRSVE